MLPQQTTAAAASPASPVCAICLEDVKARTSVTLECGHEFHLSCIGGAFNAKKRMECPMCRNVESGEWRTEFERGTDDCPVDGWHFRAVIFPRHPGLAPQEMFEALHFLLDTVMLRAQGLEPSGVDSRLEDVDSRLEGVDSRMDISPSRWDGAHRRLNSRLEDVNNRLEGVNSRLQGVHSRVNSRSQDVHSRLERHFRTREVVEATETTVLRQEIRHLRLICNLRQEIRHLRLELGAPGA